MADLTRHDMQIIDEHDHARDELTRSYLERAGVQVRVLHATGDSSSDTTYELRYSFVTGSGPTFDLAISSFVEALLKHVPVEKAGQAEQVRAYNAEMDERNRIARENIDKPWLPLHDGE